MTLLALYLVVICKWWQIYVLEMFFSFVLCHSFEFVFFQFLFCFNISFFLLYLMFLMSLNFPQMSCYCFRHTEKQNSFTISFSQKLIHFVIRIKFSIAFFAGIRCPLFLHLNFTVRINNFWMVEEYSIGHMIQQFLKVLVSFLPSLLQNLKSHYLYIYLLKINDGIITR